VLDVAVVFLANVLHQLALQHHWMSGELPRLSVCLGVIDGVLNFEMPEVWTPNSFDDMQSFCGRQARFIDPGFPVQANGVDDERIAVPAAD